ncbi:hypothetical protein D3C72_1885480 [compost metagenome]
MVLPTAVLQQAGAGAEIRHRGGIGGGRLGALACEQVEFGQLLAFGARRDQCGAAIEVADDFEDCLVALRRRRAGGQQPADPQMRLAAQGLGNQRVGGFMHAVVHERIGGFLPDHQFLANRLPQYCVDLHLGHAEHRRQRRDLGSVAEAR